MYNGPWELSLGKTGSSVKISHIANKDYDDVEFTPPKLGKPYDDEFNLIEPIVTMRPDGNNMVLKAEFVSKKFEGMVVTQVYSLSASGFITRRCKIENRGDKAQHVHLNDSAWFELDDSTIFSYNGQITQNHEVPNTNGRMDGMDSTNPDLLDENWIFEATPGAPKGFAWSKNYKPSFKWGSYAFFEIDPGELAVGESFVTEPLVCVLGAFSSYTQMRDYALQSFTDKNILPNRTIEIELNGYNPFITNDSIKLDVVNHREAINAGEISVHGELFEPQSQTNGDEEVVERNSFNLSLKPHNNLSLVTVDMKLLGYEKSFNHAMFFPKGEIIRAKEGGAYVVSNGAVTFKADPAYGNACYSLVDAKGQEWLLSNYPEHKPFSWWNPFIGGISINPPGMNPIAILKEEITTNFTELKDNFGNLWQGICSTLTITNDNNLKNARFQTYYLTLPGLPLLCTFYRFENGTGEYKQFRMNSSMFYNPCETATDIIVDATNKNRREYRLKMGTGDAPYVSFEDIVKIAGSRAEKLYVFCGNKDSDTTQNYVEGDNKFPVATFTYNLFNTAHGECENSQPLFVLLEDRDLPNGALRDLGRVRFD